MEDGTIKRSDAIKAITNHCENECCYRADSWCPQCQREEFQEAINAVLPADRPQETCLKEAEILLKATRNLLDKQNETIYVLNMLEETVTYYGVECDGSCLIEDIDAWLELYGSEKGTNDE